MASPRTPVSTADGTERRLFVFARHAESAANAGHVLATDPARPVALTKRGCAQARALGAQLANLPIDLAVCSRLLRARETISITLGGRAVPVLVEPGFDEIRAGDLDGEPIQAYWDWLGQHTADDRLPHSAKVSTTRCGAMRAPCAGFWPGPDRSRWWLPTSWPCGISPRRPLRAAASPCPTRTSATRFRISSTPAPSGVPQPAWLPKVRRLR